MAAWPVMMSLGMGGGILGIVYSIFDYIFDQIKRRMYCSIEIKYDDDTYRWVQKYMLETGKVAEKGTMKVQMKRNNNPWWHEIFQSKDDRKKPDIEYVAGSGYHICKFKGKTIFAE